MKLRAIRAHYNEAAAAMLLVEEYDDGTSGSCDYAETPTKVHAYAVDARGWTTWLLDRPMSWVTFTTDASGIQRGAFLVEPKDSVGKDPPLRFIRSAEEREARVTYPRAVRGAA